MPNGAMIHIDTRQRIINAALLVAAKEGFERATTERISKAAGVSEGIIYHYFKSKQELYISMIKERVDNYRQALKNEIAHIHSPKRKLERLIDFHFANFTGKKSMFHGVLDRTSDTPVIKEQLLKIAMVPYCRMIAEIIKEGVKTGDFRNVDPSVTAFSLLGMIQVLALVMHFGQAGFSTRHAADTVKHIFFGGLLR